MQKKTLEDIKVYIEAAQIGGAIGDARKVIARVDEIVKEIDEEIAMIDKPE